MKVDRIELRNKLAALRPGLAKREFVQQSCHFIFLKNEIVSFNDKIAIMVPFESEEEFSVKGEEFFRLIDGMKGETLTLTIEKGKVKLRSQDTTSTMATISEDQNTLPKVIEELKEKMTGYKLLPKDFLEGISLCSFSTSADLSRGVLACVAVDGDSCYSLDSNRSSMYKMKTKMRDSFFIVGREAVELVKFPVTSYCTDGKWCHFKTKEDVTFSCLLMTGEFPIKKMIPVFEKMKELPCIELPSELKTVVENVTVLAADDITRSGKAVYISMADNEITVKASNDLGRVEKKLACDYEGDEINMIINSNLLSQILSRATSLSKDKDMLHFKAESFQHILMSIPKKEED